MPGRNQRKNRRLRRRMTNHSAQYWRLGGWTGVRPFVRTRDLARKTGDDAAASTEPFLSPLELLGPNSTHARTWRRPPYSGFTKCFTVPSRDRTLPEIVPMLAVPDHLTSGTAANARLSFDVTTEPALRFESTVVFPPLLEIVIRRTPFAVFSEASKLIRWSGPALGSVRPFSRHCDNSRETFFLRRDLIFWPVDGRRMVCRVHRP